MKTFQYFQPEYVSEFQCDGSKCDARCCKGWTITIDAATYKKYSRIKPKSKAKEIISRMKFDSEQGMYVIQLKEDTSCPFLTENKLCSLQLEYGEEILSQTCSTYPRRTHKIGNFFERSLTLTCPAAAELILFNSEPMKFEFVEVPDKIHSKHGRIQITKLPVKEHDADLIREVQITMITVLQERTLSIDQRLILLGLFLDRLQEYQTEKQSKEILLQLIAGYRSKEFLSGEAVHLTEHFAFDAQKFMTFMIKFISHTLDCLKTEDGRKFLVKFEETLGIKPDENNQVYIPENMCSQTFD
ncbi:MAG: flagellin lysine-N-methylase [Selenomonadaceae bacterium]|nr:flagellin lysine-N-methylase [Selenomonadaceae bacterium]